MSAQANAPIIKKVKRSVAKDTTVGRGRSPFSVPSVVRRRFHAGLEVRPLRAGSRAILTSADAGLRFGFRSAPPLRMREQPEAGVLKEQ